MLKQYKLSNYKFILVFFVITLNTIGVFTPGTDIELPYNTLGELCITGPCVMKEYLNNGWKFGCKNKIYNK